MFALTESTQNQRNRLNFMSHTNDCRSVLERVHELQTLLGDLNGRLKRGPIVLKNQEKAIEKQQAQLDSVRETLRTLQAEAKVKENEVAANDLHIAKRKTQLQEAKTNKEYEALQLQIKADEAARGVLDDEALEALDKAENFEKTIPPVELELKKIRDLFQQTKQKLETDKPGVEADIKRYAVQLTEMEAQLPREFREIYDRLIRSVGGYEALGKVENQKFCGGCNHQIPINSLAQILQNKPIVCSSCGRLLYVPKDYVFDKG